MGEFDQPLRLITPHKKGLRVKDAQYLMRGNNVYKTDKHPIKYNIAQDSEYGLESAVTTKRVKYWLGFPLASCDYVFGQVLYEYLIGKRKLPADYKTRRAQRIKAAQQTLGFMALQNAKKYLGIQESPFGSNRQMFGAWYRMNGEPWCDIFISFNCAAIGSKFKYSYVPATVQAARYGNGAHFVSDPVPGDLAAYNIGAEHDAHIAFFDGWKSKRNGTFYDLGGNTGPHDISNGGEVLRQERSTNIVDHFIRIDK